MPSEPSRRGGFFIMSNNWKDCNHEWYVYGDFDLGGNRTEVKCSLCGCMGERNDSSGEVFWPTT